MTLNVRLLFTLIMVFVLSILPMPEIISGFRPPWVLMFILYIQFFLPNYFSIPLIFLLGLCLDVLLSMLIGEHAFAFLITTWLASWTARRFNFFSMLKQMVLVALFCFIFKLIIFLIDAFLGYHYGLWMVIGTSFLTLLLWPWVRWLLSSPPFMLRFVY